MKTFGGKSTGLLVWRSYRFIGESVKQYADRLSEEMDRRRLRFTPIDWQR
jgi:hypothetical protein